MRILHTSDWHLGKHLDYASRIPEQAAFLDEFYQIIKDQSPDLVIVAGDIFDSANPSAEAERLFYSAVKYISGDLQTPLLIIAGNHDSPERLSAVAELAAMFGVIIIGSHTPDLSGAQTDTFRLLASGSGFIKLRIKDETAVILTIPYPSERRLGKLLHASSDMDDDALLRMSFSEKIGFMLDGLSTHFEPDTVNIVTAHFYVSGGEMVDSERDIRCGGLFGVDASVFPKAAQYIALGHLHKPQRISSCPAYYSGSPIQYSKSEARQAKYVLIVDIRPGCEADVQKIYLRNYKPIEIWHADSVAEAISLCEAHTGEDSFVFLTIKTDKVIAPSDIKLMKSLKSDIIEISPELIDIDMGTVTRDEHTEAFNITDEFNEFYKEIRGVLPSEGIMELFAREILHAEERDMTVEADHAEGEGI